jgi:hypothetical protein
MPDFETGRSHLARPTIGRRRDLAARREVDIDLEQTVARIALWRDVIDLDPVRA